MTAAVSLRGLTKSYGGTRAVDDLSFDVHAGRVVGFLGPNGSGKSTTLRMAIGLTTPTAGEALIEGRPFRTLDDPGRTVGSIVDGVEYHPGRTAIEELRVSAVTMGLPRRRCDEVLEMVGLGDVGRRRVGQFSLGMRQRLGLAQALLGDPRVLLLDEPANGLDPEGIRWIRQLLRWLADDGRAVLVSSHLIGEIARLADEVVVIRRGRFVASGTIDELTGAAGGEVAHVRSTDDGALGERLAGAGAEVERDDAGALRVVGLSTEEVGRIALEAGVVLTELRGVRPELEDVFVELTGEPQQAGAAWEGGRA